MKTIKCLVIISLVWFNIQYYFTKQLEILPEYFIWLDDIALFIAVIISFILFKFSMNNIKIIKKINLSIQLFIICGVISWYLNGGSLLQLVLGLRSFLQFYLLFIVVTNTPFTKDELKIFIKIIILFCLLQLPATLYQYLFTAGNVDDIIGTLGPGDANSLGMYFLFSIILMVSFILQNYKVMESFYSLCIIAFPFIACSSRVAFFILPVLILILVLNSNLKKYINVRNMLPLLVICILVFIITKEYSATDVGEANTLDFMQNIEKEQSNKSMGRLYYLGVAYDLITSNTQTFLFGKGPASFSSSGGKYLNSPLLYDATYDATAVGVISSEIVTIMVEYGIIGLIIIISIFIEILNEFKKYKSIILDDKFSFGVILTTKVMTFFMIVSIFADITLEIYCIAYTYWLFVGYSLVSLSNIKKGYINTPSPIKI